jgi:hypothetical protein
MSTQHALYLSLIALTFLACSGRRLPPGTPPPEYEAPIVPAWSPEGAAPGAGVEPLAADPAPDAASDGGAGPELSLDAGPR